MLPVSLVSVRGVWRQSQARFHAHQFWFICRQTARAFLQSQYFKIWIKTSLGVPHPALSVCFNECIAVCPQAAVYARPRIGMDDFDLALTRHRQDLVCSPFRNQLAFMPCEHGIELGAFSQVPMRLHTIEEPTCSARRKEFPMYRANDRLRGKRLRPHLFDGRHAIPVRVGFCNGSGGR